MSDMVIMKDLAPKGKKKPKNPPIQRTSQNTEPLLYAPYNPKVRQMNISNTRIRKNQAIEAQVVSKDLAREHKVLDYLTLRKGGPYLIGSPIRRAETRRAGTDVLPGDFVVLHG